MVEYKQGLDAGLGLIFRLNDLWKHADLSAIDGDYDGWNNMLEAIWRNLSYRESMITEEGNTIVVKLSKADRQGWDVLCKNVNIAKSNWLKAKRKGSKKVRTYWARRYYRIQLKDLFLRKKMFALNLYLKESSKDISTSTFGEFK